MRLLYYITYDSNFPCRIILSTQLKGGFEGGGVRRVVPIASSLLEFLFFFPISLFEEYKIDFEHRD